MLQIKNISFGYKNALVLQNISFNVKKGEHLSVIGESGSGKSTLLKLIYGTYDLNEGDQVDILATNRSAYGYLSVEGGFEIESFCNSVSTLVKANIGHNNGKKISIEDKVIINQSRKNETKFSKKGTGTNYNPVRYEPNEKYLNPEKMIYLVVGDAATQMEKLEGLGFGKPELLNEIETEETIQQ